ncbi:hypothetical protein CRENBAI_007468 [Crenichthys baileyi]|uniref:Uncharacterized protein n=1 Tax=Crenichthys baileyi TaxID=28760 RepID=A0AAV9RUP5_9TELE
MSIPCLAHHACPGQPCRHRKRVAPQAGPPTRDTRGMHCLPPLITLTPAEPPPVYHSGRSWTTEYGPGRSPVSPTDSASPHSNPMSIRMLGKGLFSHRTAKPYPPPPGRGHTHSERIRDSHLANYPCASSSRALHSLPRARAAAHPNVLSIHHARKATSADSPRLSPLSNQHEPRGRARRGALRHVLFMCSLLRFYPCKERPQDERLLPLTGGLPLFPSPRAKDLIGAACR